VTLRGASGGEVEISGLSADSRALEPGMLFAALAGSRSDGRRFVAEAIARGAAAVLADPAFAAELDVPLVVDADPRRRLALMAARFYRRQPRCIVAVTGTSGKTSVAGFVRQLWERLGHPAASLGTLGLIAPGHGGGGGLTTPDPVRLHALLAELAAGGVEHLALEASSHGLDQRRLDGVRILAAAFTNLSRDHFDYHGSFEKYLAAKRRLFSDLLAPEGTAVLNADQPESAGLADLCRERGIAVLDYGAKARRLRLVARHEAFIRRAEGDRRDAGIARRVVGGAAVELVVDHN
jgi:UDP-N-acetylmuramoyl-L-alanyl-D-glutamate--2,6-diaminopimelate ligase